MQDFFNTWLDVSKKTKQKKKLWRATEADGQRESALDELPTRVRTHYIKDSEIAIYLELLGYKGAAKAIRLNYPKGPKGRSADIGEILCTEVVEEWCKFEVPIRKLQYKDHREQAMRGEDVIGVRRDNSGRFCLLKGEAKSAQSLSTETVKSARNGLERNSGRPSSHSIIFLARRLFEQGEQKKALGKEILLEAYRKSVSKDRITHCIFAITGSPAKQMLDDDFDNADGTRDQYIIHIQIPDHRTFVEQIYEKIVELALD